MRFFDAKNPDGTPRLDEEGKEQVFVGFDAKEEQEIAHVVFQFLACPTYRGADRDWLDEVFWLGRCKNPTVIWIDQLSRLMDIIEGCVRINKNFPDQGYPLIDVPSFLFANPEPKNDCLFDMDRNKQGIMLTFLIWREEWELVKEQLCSISNMYKKFPGAQSEFDRHMIQNPEAELQRATAYEERFWTEFELVRKQFAVSLNRSDCYDYTKDYMRRGRDVIPRVLLPDWLAVEKNLHLVIPGAVHRDEEWLEEVLEYAKERRRLLLEPRFSDI